MPPLPPDILHALVKSIELKDDATAHHTWRVVLYTRALAEAAGLDLGTIARLTTAAALHDLGKIDIPDEILRKPGPLTPDEFAVIQTHPALGHDRLVRMGETDPLILDLVRHHHERIDGRGYPDGLAGDQIPLPARHFAVIDAFDAMTSIRPYRRDIGAHAARRAIAELEAGVGTRYCANCVELFANLYRKGELDWILHHFNEGSTAPQFGAEPATIDEFVRALRRPG